jgi:hypothetical protein
MDENMTPFIHNPLVSFCQGAIMKLRPVSLNKYTGYLPSLGSRCEQRGATILHIWLPCVTQTYGTQALVVPLFYFGTAVSHHNDYEQRPTRNKTKENPYLDFRHTGRSNTGSFRFAFCGWYSSACGCFSLFLYYAWRFSVFDWCHLLRRHFSFSNWRQINL